MDVRALIKPLIPVAVRDWQRERRKHKFYRSWARAEAACGDAYSDLMLNRFRVERAALNTTPVTLDPMLCSVSKPQMRITDFGGAVGLHGRAFLDRFPNCTYVVVESPAMASVANMPGIIFTSEIPQKCDVFFSSGTLQCISNPYETLDAGFKSASKAVVLVRNSFAKHEWFRVHKSRLFDNGDGPIPEGFTDCEIQYPNRTIQERKVQAIAKRHGFRLTISREDTTGVIPYFHKVYGRNLVFTRSV